LEEVMWRVIYKKSVAKDLKTISKENKYLIKRAIEEKLSKDPLKFGLPLRKTLKGYMKLRVGDFRIIYTVTKKSVTVYVIKIGHRRDVYKKH
jgi:mRNA interferase RelE/StbE